MQSKKSVRDPTRENGWVGELRPTRKPRYFRTPRDARSAKISGFSHSSQPFSNGGTRKTRRSGVSQSEEFGAGGDPPMGATSLMVWI